MKRDELENREPVWQMVEKCKKFRSIRRLIEDILDEYHIVNANDLKNFEAAILHESVEELKYVKSTIERRIQYAWKQKLKEKREENGNTDN